MTVEITKKDETTETITTDLTEVLSKLDEGGNTPLDIEGRGGFNGKVMTWVVEEKRIFRLVKIIKNFKDLSNEKEHMFCYAGCFDDGRLQQ